MKHGPLLAVLLIFFLLFVSACQTLPAPDPHAIVVAVGVRLFKGAGDRASQAEDARTIQEIYQGLSRLEKRIETLETILLDRTREAQRE